MTIHVPSVRSPPGEVNFAAARSRVWSPKHRQLESAGASELCLIAQGHHPLWEDLEGWGDMAC